MAMKFIIADDHPLIRGALRQALAAIDPDAEVLEAGDFDTVSAIAAAHADIDLALLDLTMPGASGFSGLIALRGMEAGMPLVVVSARDDAATVRRALDLGASGFIPKSATLDEIRNAVRTVLDGGIARPPGVELGVERDAEVASTLRRLRALTPQQSRVMGMVGQGLLNKQIAHALGVSEATVKAHVSAILQKLGVDSRTQAVIALGRVAGEPAAGEAITPPPAPAG